jgi:hypothetical protein
MKKMLIMSSLVFGTVLHSIAADTNTGAAKKTNTSEKVSGEKKVVATKAASKTLSATERANHLTDQMIRDLRLNNYQARKLRAINLDKVNRMMAIEAKGGDASKVDTECKGVCKERDQELENILSIDQYSIYFSNRPGYYNLDKDYASGGYMKSASAKVDKDNLADNDDDETATASTQFASR